MDINKQHTDDTVVSSNDNDALKWLTQAMANPALLSKLTELAVERNHKLGVPVHLADDVGIYLISPDGAKKYVEYF